MSKRPDCSEAGCERRYYGRGLCSKHYQRAKYHGNLDRYTRKKVRDGAPLDERLRNIGWTVTESSCWEWNGYRNPAGYGRLAVGRFRNGNNHRSVPMLANRAAYIAWVGPLADGAVVCHSCDNPPCINPDHLFVGTHADNQRDMVNKGRTRRGENRKDHRLTDAQVLEVRRLYSAGGVSQKALASEFGVSQQLVSHLVRGSRRSYLVTEVPQ